MISVGCQACGCAPTSCEECLTPAPCSNCSSCCCGEPHRSWRQARILSGVRLEYLSNAWMVVEVLGALAAGILAGSLALAAFGADSFVELVSGVAVLRHLRMDDQGSRTPGNRTALMTSVLLFALLPTIGLSSLYSFFAGVRPEGSPLGIAIAAGAVVVMPFLWLEKRRIGRETRCLPLSIDAYASATCLLVSLALLGGLLAVYLTGLWWVDYVAAGAILAFVAKEATESMKEASKKQTPLSDLVSLDRQKLVL